MERSTSPGATPLVFKSLFLLMALLVLAYVGFRSIDRAPENRVALHWALGSALVSLIGAGVLGLAHTWPAVNQWTHGTLVTPMHGHMAFFGAYGMIILAMVSFTMPYVTGNPDAVRKARGIGISAFWIMVAGMAGMTMAFAAGGVAQVYMERILGIGYLDAQLKIQVHFQMLLAAACLFTFGVLLFLWDYFGRNPRRGLHFEGGAAPGT